MKKAFFMAMAVLGAIQLRAEVNINEFKPLNANAGSGPIAQSFDTPFKMSLPPGFRFDPSGGENGTGALFFEKTDPASYQLAGWTLQLEPGHKYTATINVKCEEVRGLQDADCKYFCIEFTKKGKYVAGAYYYKTLENGKWSPVKLDVQVPADFDRAAATFLLARHGTGKVWWDNLQIDDVGSLFASISVQTPANLTLRNGGGKLVLTSKLLTKGVAASDLGIYLTVDGKNYFAENRNDIYAFDLKDLAPGRYDCSAKLLNIKTKNVVAEKSFAIFSTNDVPRANNSTTDEYGRTIVNGKPFMPLGFFCGFLDEKIMKKASEGGFNFILPYNMRHTGEGAFSSQLTNAEKYNLKLMLNVYYQLPRFKWAVKSFEGATGIDNVVKAWAEKYKKHPAMLGYYVSDENPLVEIPQLCKMRETLAEADPDHITVTLTYLPLHFPFFAETGEVLAVDIYPIEKRTGSTLRNVIDVVTEAKKNKTAVWYVPQAFNWGAHKTKNLNEYREYRFPTEEEMRSMSLAGAISGAKGFLFFSYLSIFEISEKMEPGSADESWEKVTRAAKSIKSLEEFILSIEPAPGITITGTPNVIAKIWRSQGKTAIAVVGIGPGACKVEFTLADMPGLKSRYGHTVETSPGHYVFTGDGICSDVLLSENK